MQDIWQTQGAQIRQAVGFVGSVVVYGAAALSPFWVPIAVGKRRRRSAVDEELFHDDGVEHGDLEELFPDEEAEQDERWELMGEYNEVRTFSDVDKYSTDSSLHPYVRFRALYPRIQRDLSGTEVRLERKVKSTI